MALGPTLHPTFVRRVAHALILAIYAMAYTHVGFPLAGQLLVAEPREQAPAITTVAAEPRCQCGCKGSCCMGGHCCCCPDRTSPRSDADAAAPAPFPCWNSHCPMSPGPSGVVSQSPLLPHLAAASTGLGVLPPSRVVHVGDPPRLCRVDRDPPRKIPIA